MKSLTIFALIFMAFTAGCVSQTYPQTLAQGSASGIEDAREMVITDQSEWESFWSELNANVQPVPDLPEIDFSREMVIAVTLGMRSTTGYSVNITGVDEEEDSITVTYLEMQPPWDAIVGQALTQPYHVIKIQKSDKPVEFSGLIFFKGRPVN